MTKKVKRGDNKSARFKIPFNLKGINILNLLRSIRLKLFIGLLIPIILLAVYGTVSYNKSEEAIISNYEDSAQDTLVAVSDFLGFGFNIIKEKSAEMLLNSNINGYYNRQEGESESNFITARFAVESDVQLIKKTNSFISAVFLMGKDGETISTQAATQDSRYNEFMETALGKQFESRSVKYLWVGNHEQFDSSISYSDVKYSINDYALSLITPMNSRKGFIIIDVSKQKIMDMFTKYELGENSIVAFITKDGREILSGTDEESVFLQQTYYEDAVNSDVQYNHSYQKYKGKEYLFIYSKISDVDAMVCAMIPKSDILEQVSGIKALNIAFVSVSCVLAILIVIIIAGGVNSAISFLSKKITQAATGDLTTSFETKRKDEFLHLSTGIGNMLRDMRSLIGDVQAVSSKVSNSADGVSGTSVKLLEATKDISKTIEDIEQGIVQQANDTEHCLMQMAGLSDQINQVHNNTQEIEKIADNTKMIAGEGIVIIDELSEKAKATTDITQNVIAKIQEFEDQSRNIVSFVDIINEIAEQTNLLSLNASIEAARAGEAGRGFAVVANEIRKLADQSVQAANQIQKIVTQIQKKTQDTVVTAKQAESIVESQSESLGKTVQVFDNINRHVNDLVNNLNNISEGIQKIDAAKVDTMDAIQSISAVSEETAAASEEVNTTAINQIESVERLKVAAQELANDAKRLEESIKKFTI